MARRIFVGNLSYGTNEEALRSLFENGQRAVKEVRIITDRESGRSRGFGFVELADASQAEQAIQDLDGVELDGRRLSLREAFDRQRGGGGGPPSRGRDEPRAEVMNRRGNGGGRPDRGGPGGRSDRGGPGGPGGPGGRGRPDREGGPGGPRGGGRGGPRRDFGGGGPPVPPPDMMVVDEEKERGRRRRKQKEKRREEFDDDDW